MSWDMMPMCRHNYRHLQPICMLFATYTIHFISKCISANAMTICYQCIWYCTHDDAVAFDFRYFSFDFDEYGFDGIYIFFRASLASFSLHRALRFFHFRKFRRRCFRAPLSFKRYIIASRIKGQLRRTHFFICTSPLLSPLSPRSRLRRFARSSFLYFTAILFLEALILMPLIPASAYSLLLAALFFWAHWFLSHFSIFSFADLVLFASPHLPLRLASAHGRFTRRYIPSLICFAYMPQSARSIPYLSACTPAISLPCINHILWAFSPRHSQYRVILSWVYALTLISLAGLFDYIIFRPMPSYFVMHFAATLAIFIILLRISRY